MEVVQADQVIAPVGTFSNIQNQFGRVVGRLTTLESNQNEDKSDEIHLTERKTKAFAVSMQAASQKFSTTPSSTSRIDTRTITLNNVQYYLWLFSKSLKHDDNGLCRKVDLDRLINYDGTVSALEALEQSRTPNAVLRLEGVQTSNSYLLAGPDPHEYDVAAEMYAVDDRRHVAEMIEVYEKSLLRDVSFHTIQTGNDPGVNRALASLNAYRVLGAYTGPVNAISGEITGHELFRGMSPDELVGPYISQFWVLPFTYNSIPIEQKYQVENDQPAQSLTDFVNLQRGLIDDPPVLAGHSAHVFSGRVAASYVRSDVPLTTYLNSALIALNLGVELQHTGTATTTAWTDGGAVDLFAALSDVTVGALRTAWHSKFNKCLKLRPEAFAHRVDRILSHTWGSAFNVIENQLQPGLPTLNAVFAHSGNQNYLLRQMYGSGSPTHPSYPAGHGVIAGACVTVLKAFFVTHGPGFVPLSWPTTPRHSLSGETLTDYKETDHDKITIVGEFNKLSSNIAIARNTSGMHFRADGDKGILLGEQFAITYLQGKLKEYASTYLGIMQNFELEKFNGDYIRISPDNIDILHARSEWSTILMNAHVSSWDSKSIA